jgi:divalent metal cation (Fe/Co/Zn/Cd) transporter
MFIFVIAGLSIIAEILGMIISASILDTGGGFGWTNLFGLVGGVLAFLGAASIGKAAASPPPAAPAPQA